MTELQKTFTKEQGIQIVKIMHPSLSEEQLNKIQFHFRYCWICIDFKVKGYGQIAIGVDNHYSGSSLFG